MKNISITILALALSAGVAQADNAFEMIRITVNKTGGKITARTDCQINSTSVKHVTTVEDMTTTRSTPMEMSWDHAETVQWHVDAAEGLWVAPHHYEESQRYTNWWVRSGPWEEFKLVRTNISKPNGDGVVKAIGGPLARFIGANCFVSFD